MEKLTQYLSAVKAVLSPLIAWTDLDPRIETLCIFDDTTHNYVVVQTGWEDGERFYHPLIHLRIADERVKILWNTTNLALDHLLLEAGILLCGSRAR